jgi:hypothetical protein
MTEKLQAHAARLVHGSDKQMGVVNIPVQSSFHLPVDVTRFSISKNISSITLTLNTRL